MQAIGQDDASRSRSRDQRLFTDRQERFNAFEDYDKAVEAVKQWKRVTMWLFYSFWFMFFTIIILTFLYYDVQRFSLEGSQWYIITIILCSTMAGVYLMMRLFDCLANVF